jgi:hypothetical protein
MFTGWMMALPVMVLLVSTTCLQAAPTTNISDNDLLGHSGFSITQGQRKALPIVTPGPDGIGIKTAGPHIAFAMPGNSRTDTVRYSPAMPTAVLMVLIGFLCISLVRDRGVWLTALSAILWISWAGIRSLPQLASHFSPKPHADKYFAPRAAEFYLLKNIDRTQREDHHRQFKLLTTKSLFATILLTCCLVPITRCIIYFKPAFIFKNLSRGPPQTARPQLFAQY